MMWEVEQRMSGEKKQSGWYSYIRTLEEVGNQHWLQHLQKLSEYKIYYQEQQGYLHKDYQYSLEINIHNFLYP